MLINKDSIRFQYINIYSLQKERIGIPIFQRFYSWREKQLVELLNDFLGAIDDENKELYLLDFIWYSEDEKIKLADGQQRVVTLNLLIKAINDFINAENLNLEKLNLFDISYDNIEYDKKYKMNFNDYDLAPFKKIYLALLQFVKENRTNLEKIINIIKNRIYVYMKETDTPDSAFDIFTQINTGGKPLSKDDVIKTAISQYSKIYNISINSSIKELKRAISSYYKFINTNNNENFDSIAIMTFLKKHIVKNKETFTNFSNYLITIAKLSDNAIYTVIEYIKKTQMLDILNVMAIMGIDISKDKMYLQYVIFPLCLLSIISSIKNVNPGGRGRSLYAKVIQLVKERKPYDKIGESIASFINDNTDICKISYSDFVEGLGKVELSLKSKEALLILDIIMHSTSSNLNMKSINVEHIYPQKPKSEWAINGWPTNYEERKKYTNNIGNLLILNEVVNKKIQNKYIDDKIIEYNKIIPKDLALKTEINQINFNEFKTNKTEYIKKRQREIAQNIYDNFPLAKVMIFKK